MVSFSNGWSCMVSFSNRYLFLSCQHLRLQAKQYSLSTLLTAGVLVRFRRLGLNRNDTEPFSK